MVGELTKLRCGQALSIEISELVEEFLTYVETHPEKGHERATTVLEEVICKD